MSQYGADGYAQHGATYQFILAHYYQRTQLRHDRSRPGRPGAAEHRLGLVQRRQPAAGPGGSGSVRLSAGSTYDVVAASGGRLALRRAQGTRSAASPRR